MKKFITILLIVCLVSSLFAGCGNKEQDDTQGTVAPSVAPTAAPGQPATDISAMTPEEIFRFDPATNSILGFQDNIFGVTDIVIPNEINGQAVKAIGTKAFYDQGLLNVVFPDSLEKIGNNAFSNNYLTKIDLPSGLTVMETAAFEKNDLVEVVIPPSITEIGIGIFSSNEIAKLTLPDTLTAIRRSAFAVNKLTELVLPPLVKIIESYAFSDNLIETVEFNDGLERIDGLAFSINSLTSISIPASVKTIGLASDGVDKPSNYERFPFAYNPKLTSVTMMGSDTVIEPFFLAENNNFRMAYLNGGAGTYIGSQYGQWKKE